MPPPLRRARQADMSLRQVAHAARRSGRATRAEVLPQRACPRSRCGTSRAPAAAAPPCRRSSSRPPGVMCGTRMKPSLASSCTNVSMVSATVRGGADERLPPGDLDDQLADRQLLRGRALAPLVGGGDRVAVHPHARPAPGDGVLAGVGIDVGQRAVGVVGGQVAVPQLLEELDRGLPADLLQPDLVGEFLRLGVGVAEHERGGRQDQQLVVGTAVPGQPALDVGVERLPVVERAVPAEDRVGRRRRELPALVGVAGLEDHRPALRAAGHVELPGDVEVVVVMLRSDRRRRRPGTRRTPCRRRSRRRARSRTAPTSSAGTARPASSAGPARGSRRGGSSRR